MACLQQTVPTASVPTASAAAGAVQVNATRSTTSMRPANASEYERDSMDCQDADTPVHSGQRDPRTPMKGHARNPAGDEDGWQTVLTLRQKKALAQGKKLKANVVENEGNASQPQLSQATPSARRKPFSRKLPPLPKEDFKVVIRPHQGLPLKNFTSPQLAEAVITACRGQVSGDKFLLRLKPGSNIFIVSTPDQATADHIRRITELRVHGRTHAVNAYVATGEGTGKGVIHGLTPHTPAETLRANLRIRTQGVEILRARMLGDTKTAVITFYGPIIPRYVYYMAVTTTTKMAQLRRLGRLGGRRRGMAFAAPRKSQEKTQGSVTIEVYHEDKEAQGDITLPIPVKIEAKRCRRRHS
ncbi:hypothetical protein MTO96_000303 [Rhipicephalus appendiculatus]